MTSAVWLIKFCTVKLDDFDNNLDIAGLHVVWATTPSYKRDMLL